jgi:hypothetical protein
MRFEAHTTGKQAELVRKAFFIAAGCIAIAIAILFNVAIIRNLSTGNLHKLNLAFSFVCLLSFYWMGIRAIKIATSPVYAAQKRVAIWTVFLGCSLIAIQLKNHFAPLPNLLKADNAAQAMGMMIGSALIVFFAIWLIYSGFEEKWKSNLKHDHD